MRRITGRACINHGRTSSRGRCRLRRHLRCISAASPPPLRRLSATSPPHRRTRPLPPPSHPHCNRTRTATGATPSDGVPHLRRRPTQAHPTAAATPPTEPCPPLAMQPYKNPPQHFLNISHPPRSQPPWVSSRGWPSHNEPHCTTTTPRATCTTATLAGWASTEQLYTAHDWWRTARDEHAASSPARRAHARRAAPPPRRPAAPPPPAAQLSAPRQALPELVAGFSWPLLTALIHSQRGPSLSSRALAPRCSRQGTRHVPPARSLSAAGQLVERALRPDWGRRLLRPRDAAQGKGRSYAPQSPPRAT